MRILSVVISAVIAIAYYFVWPGWKDPQLVAPAVAFVQNHFEVVPPSHLGVACRSLLSPNEASGGLSGWRLFDIYRHVGT